MGVNASMSMSIMQNTSLWGLVACHGYAGGRPSVPVRHFCKLVSETFSNVIESRQLQKSIRDTRSFVSVSSPPMQPQATSVSSGLQVPTVIAGTVSDLLTLFDANFGILCVDGESKLLGETAVEPREIISIVNFVKSRHFERICSTDRLREFEPGLCSLVAGFLYIPLSPTVTAGGPGDFVLFCRLEQIQNINWAGDPNETVSFDSNTLTLQPRSSFKIWKETVRGVSCAWTPDILDMAGMLQLVYGRFMHVWREKERAESRNRLKNLLIGSVSHDVRTPLNAVIGYLELALERTMDDELRESLNICYNASKSLIFIVNDLLDLTRFEAGKMLFRSEPFSLRAVIDATIPIFKADAMKRGLCFEVVCDDDVPSVVIGDGPKISQCLTNLCSNAIKFTEKGSITIRCKKVDESLETVNIEIIVIDTGIGIPADKLDRIFLDFEQITNVLSHKTKGTGLGMAIVSRIMTNMKGTLRVESTEGVGTTFTCKIPFKKINETHSAPKNQVAPKLGVDDLGIVLISRSDSMSSVLPSKAISKEVESSSGTTILTITPPALPLSPECRTPTTTSHISMVDRNAIISSNSTQLPPMITKAAKSLTILAAEDNPIK